MERVFAQSGFALRVVEYRETNSFDFLQKQRLLVLFHCVAIVITVAPLTVMISLAGVTHVVDSESVGKSGCRKEASSGRQGKGAMVSWDFERRSVHSRVMFVWMRADVTFC